jgi:hypothetical protein
MMRAYDFSNGYGLGFVRYMMEASSPDTMTASMAGPMKLPTAKLAELIHASSEHDYAAAMKSDLEEPVILGIAANGTPSIIKGMTSVAAARDRGIEYIPAQVQWFGGSDQLKDSPYCPAAITHMAQWD